MALKRAPFRRTRHFRELDLWPKLQPITFNKPTIQEEEVKQEVQYSYLHRLCIPKVWWSWDSRILTGLMSHRTRAQSDLYNKLVLKHKMRPTSHGKRIESLPYPTASSDPRWRYLLISVQFTPLDPIDSRPWACWHRPRALEHQCSVACHSDGGKILWTQNCVHWAFSVWLQWLHRNSLE